MQSERIAAGASASAATPGTDSEAAASPPAKPEIADGSTTIAELPPL